MPPVDAKALRFFEKIGVLEAISPPQERLVIYDMSYRFPKHTPVYRFDPDVDPTKPHLHPRVPQQTLAPGMRLGFTATYNRSAKYSRVIKEVWILPPGSFQLSAE